MTDTKHPGGLVLQAHHDAELDASEAAAVAAHCERCEGCRSELSELVRMARLLNAAPVPELPHSVWHRVRPGRSREPRLRPALAFAACAAGIALGVLLGPIRLGSEPGNSEATWTENLTVWSGDATSALLAVYQTGRE